MVDSLDDAGKRALRDASETWRRVFSGRERDDDDDGADSNDLPQRVEEDTATTYSILELKRLHRTGLRYTVLIQNGAQLKMACNEIVDILATVPWGGQHRLLSNILFGDRRIGNREMLQELRNSIRVYLCSSFKQHYFGTREVSVDESMIKVKGSLSLKQYNPMKRPL